MKSHVKKLIAPIVITGIILLYFIGFLVAGIFFAPIPWFIKLFGIVIPLLLSGVSIYVLRERIKEIRSGEEDDLSKY